MKAGSKYIRYILPLFVMALFSWSGIKAETPETPETPETSEKKQPNRRITPVETPSTMTTSRNEVLNDTARINKLRRERSIIYKNDKGENVYIDTLTGEKWQDTLALQSRIPKMEYPLFYKLAGGVNLWDAVMRACGQDYGLFSVWAELNMHNRYLPRIEIGMGDCDHRPDNSSYHYKSSAAPFLKLGCRYNFFYNSNPDYLLMAGMNYGISNFKYTVSDITVDSPYWGESVTFSLPKQSATVGWIEFTLGLRVKIAGSISAGWSVVFHRILHEGKAAYGRPWYIPGMGSRTSSVCGEISVCYTLPLNKKGKKKVENINKEDGAVAPPPVEPAAVTSENIQP